MNKKAHPKIWHTKILGALQGARYAFLRKAMGAPCKAPQEIFVFGCFFLPSCEAARGKVILKAKLAREDCDSLVVLPTLCGYTAR